MSKNSPQQPAVPDPAKTASAQTGTNVQTAIANAVIGNADTYGPQGSTKYNQIGSQKITGPDGQVYDVPKYSQTTTLSPEQQQLYNQQTQLGSGLNNLAISQTDKLSGILGSPVNTSGLPAMAGAPNTATTDFSAAARGMAPTDYSKGLTSDFSADRSSVEKALFDRLNPQLEKDRASLENNLTNQGFQRGTQAFTNAMDQYGRQSNDARLAVTGQGLQEQQGLYGMARDKAGFGASEQQRAFDQAMQAGQFGSGEQNRAFNTQMSGAQFGNQARQQSLQEILALRNQPLNEISALRSGGQVSLPNAPQYNAPQVANTDLMGATFNSAALANKQYEQQMAQQNAQMGGMFGLGQAGILGAAKMAPLFLSDRRLKRDITDLGIRLLNGLKLYAYRYLWDDKPRAGVMADEVLRVNPLAVSTVGGFLAVNYRMLAHGL